MYKKKISLTGSITVFASLSLLLVASFLLALLEAARVKGLEAYGRMQRVNAIESVFSEYERDLFETYGIFLLDGSYGEDTLLFSQINARLQSVSQNNLRPAFAMQKWRNAVNFYQMDATDATVTGYLLATDCDGAPFRKMAAQSMRARYPAELLQTLYDGLQNADQAMTQANESRAAMDQAQENIRTAREEQARAAAAQSEEEQSQTPVQVPVENPIDVVKVFKDADILTLVTPSGSTVSGKSIRGRETLEHRRLLQGNLLWQESESWYDTILYQQFLQTQFGCYREKCAGDGALDYELEYIEAGKQSDRENLKSVVQKLLLLREGVNFAYLQTDVVKKQEAYGVATALAASVGIAPAAGLIAQGILAAWAYAESILDVRTLLVGGKIAWMKTAESWSSSLLGLGALLTGSARAKEVESGEDYQGYLQKLLYLKSKRSLNYRAMDLLELRAGMKGNRKLRMDTMLLALEAEMTYVAEPLFSDLVTLQRLQTGQWEFSETVYYSYFLKK